MSFAWDIDHHAVVDTCGNLYFHHLFAAYYTFTSAASASVLDNGARASASRTGGLCLHGAKHGAHGAVNHARAFALSAGLCLSVLASCSMAFGTDNVLLHLEFLGYSGEYFVECQPYVDSQVAALELWSATSA